MKLTNKHNLPRTLVSAIENDQYSNPADMGTTTMIRPYQQVALQRRYGHKLSEDVADRIWILVGNNTHDILHRVNTPDTVKEWRFYLPVMGWWLSGQIDCWEAGTLSADWKVTSVWSVIQGLKFDHEAQANVNAYIIGKSPYSDYLPIRKLQIVNILRDWSKHQVKKSNPDYPKCQVVVQDVPMWDDNKTLNYIIHRMSGHQSGRLTQDSQLPYCSPDERWEKPTIYKVRSKNRKTSHRNLPTAEEASAWMEKTGKGDSIEIVIGEQTRCLHYCSVSQYCKQFEKIRGE